MNIALSIALAATVASLAAWVWLMLGRGFFWRMDQWLASDDVGPSDGFQWPEVRVIVPARNEAEMLPHSLPSLLKQDYPGPFEVLLVDDHSDDGTSEAARKIACDTGASDRLTVVEAGPLPSGWTGKLWALEQGVRAGGPARAEFLLLTDADIAHPPENLRALVHKACSQNLDLVSLMARLRLETAWDRMLLPAFVFFFAKLYPFRWVNDPRRPVAAAAGGCVLLRRQALERAGGLEMVAGELIDDCALAKLVKQNGRAGGGGTWLGLSQDVHSLRSYGGLTGIWGMVARSAFTQLRHSPLLLAGTVLGMVLVYAVPVLGAAAGLVAGGLDQQPTLAWWLVATGLLAWVLMAGSYLPILKAYRAPALFGFLLPFTAALYTLMTIDSAWRFWRGKGGAWKGRTYGRPSPDPHRRSRGER